MGALLGHLLILLLPAKVANWITIASFIVIAPVLVSVLWTIWRTGRIVRRALGRRATAAQQVSIKTWMALPAAELEACARDLKGTD